MKPLILASQSPRRLELLRQIGIEPEVQPVDIDETPRPGEAPEAFVERITRAKADAAATRFPGRWILAADTAVVLGQRIMGKPDSQQQAINMLLALAGRSHEVLTGVAVQRDQHYEYRLCRSQVHFRPISAGEALAYWQTGEPTDKAGGYAIQGRGALFIERICGSYSGIMGLPLFETGQLLHSVISPEESSLDPAH